MLRESTKPSESDLQFELYKSLRAELVGYVEKVPALWLQKFLLVGGVIAFIATNQGPLKGSGDLLTAAIVAIPILSILLDAKIGEYGLHARAISAFIRKSFAESTIVAEWESTLWGDQGAPEIVSLVRLRTLITAAVTVAPTIILIIVAGLAVDDVRSRGLTVKSSLFFDMALIVAAAYTLGAIVMWYKVWPGRRVRNQRKSAPNSSVRADG